MSRFLAIDLDPAGAFVAAGTARGGTARVEKAFAWTDPARPPLTPDTAEAFGKALRDALKAAGIAPAPAVVGVGRDRVVVKDVRYPPVPDPEEPAVVRFQAMKELSESPDDLVLDYVRTGAGVGDGDRRATVVAVRKDLFRAVGIMAAAAGLKLAGVTPRPFAAAALLRRVWADGTVAGPDQPTDAAAVFTHGPKGGEFTVVRAGVVAFSRPVAGPVVANPSLLAAELKRNLTVFAGQDPRGPVTAVYVSEGANPLRESPADRLGDVLPVPVRGFDPLAGSTADVPPAQRGAFAGAVGLLAAKAGGLPVDFVAPRQPVAGPDPRRKLIALTALAAVLLLAVGGGWGFLKLAAAGRALDALQAEKQAVDQQLATLDAEAKKVRAVDDWTAREVVWLDELYDLSDRFPDVDQARVSVFNAAVLPPDKNGKTPASGQMDLKFAVKSADAAERLATAFRTDNTEKGKFYVGTGLSAGGGATPVAGFSQPFTLGTKVNRRSPADYVRVAKQSPPPRGKAEVSPPPAAAKTEPKPPGAGGRPANLDDDFFQ